MSLTKKDIQQIGSVVDQKLDRKLKPIKKQLKQIKSTLDVHILQTDRQLNYHHRRLIQLEEKTGVERPPFIPPVN